MAYGKIKADTLVYDNSGSDAEVTLASLGNKAGLASPAFTGTPTAPTAAGDTNTTQIATTAYVQTELGDYLTTALGAPKASPALTGTATAVNLTLSGNLTVNGTTTTIDSTTLNVEDKNIELGKVDTPTDTTADGGGITLKGATDKTFNWVDATDAWTSSEHIALGDSKELKIGAGADLNIYHNGTNSYISNTTGGLFINNTANISLRPNNTQDGVHINAGGSVELYHNNVKKIETTAAGVTVTGSVTDDKGDVRKIPAKDQGGASEYTLVASDAGKTILRYGGGLTIPANILASGDAVTIINASGSDITLTQGSGQTIYNSADGSTGNRTLAARGMATVWFSGGTAGYISGAGLS